MKLLILGGTRFLGRHLVQQALAAGHQVTLLHRGQSGPDLFPAARHCIADRDGDLAAALAGGSWDAAIDTSAYFPRQVRGAAAALAGRVGQYQLVSSISVYAHFDADTTAEDAPVLTLPDAEQHSAITGANYGGLKAACEAEALAAFGDGCLVARPGLLVGPFDPTGRFTWWAQRFVRAAQGEADVLVPGPPETPAQCIDARDAAAWLLRQAETGSHGMFNLTGPEAPATLGSLMAAAQQALAPQARLQWVDEGFLLARGVAPWSELPVWLPAAQAGLHRTDIRRALAAGLHCRPLADTFRDTAAWAASAPPPVLGTPLRPQVGLAPAREAELLAAWRSGS